MTVRLLLLLSLLLTGCGYRFGSGALVDSYRTISVPYVQGDEDGELTAALVRQLSATGQLTYCRYGGDLTLNVCILRRYDNDVGFRYDRKDCGQLTNSVIPTETRLTLVAQVSVVENNTCCQLIGPIVLKASVDFDHDYYSSRNAVNVFSLGQLTDIEAAVDAVRRPLNEKLAKKIVDYITETW
ncbi:MAG: LptE family protein [Chlamydiales bacterium]|nr:LptE family protein [Chlamydiia bacterium]MCP5506923.1 LptE family protein [Chlamydiales bacterium]